MCSRKGKLFKFKISSDLLTHNFWGHLKKKKKRFIAICLTEEWEKNWKVVRHDKEVDTSESGAGFKVAKWLSQVILLPTAANKHLRTKGEGKPFFENYSTGSTSQQSWRVCECLPYLPAHVWRLPFQNVLGERRGLQFIFVKRKLVYHHGLTVHTRETHRGMSRARRLTADGDGGRQQREKLLNIFFCRKDNCPQSSNSDLKQSIYS